MSDEINTISTNINRHGDLSIADGGAFCREVPGNGGGGEDYEEPRGSAKRRSRHPLRRLQHHHDRPHGFASMPMSYSTP